MPVFTIAGLTLKEAVRRRTLVGSLLLGLLVLGVSLLLIMIRGQFARNLHSGQWDPAKFAVRYAEARGVITLLCLFSIRVLGSLFAILLAGGAISGEIERGLLAVILPKPIGRWQILLGKWIGLNCVLVGSVLFWTALVWASLTLQSRVDLTPILRAAPYLALFPVVICTLTLSLSTISQRLLGTSLALTLGAFSWMDGIFNFLGTNYQVDSLHTLADVAGLLVPQGYIAWWVYYATQDIVARDVFAASPVQSSQFMKQWGIYNLSYPHMDVVYVALYVVVVFAIGVFLFQKRDV
jgi:ABC-type transport system involved in multi-copper enzyme maturation permease subunit